MYTVYISMYDCHSIFVKTSPESYQEIPLKECKWGARYLTGENLKVVCAKVSTVS